jgi:hypothetical protein
VNWSCFVPCLERDHIQDNRMADAAVRHRLRSVCLRSSSRNPTPQRARAFASGRDLKSCFLQQHPSPPAHRAFSRLSVSEVVAYPPAHAGLLRFRRPRTDSRGCAVVRGTST